MLVSDFTINHSQRQESELALKPKGPIDSSSQGGVRLLRIPFPVLAEMLNGNVHYNIDYYGDLEIIDVMDNNETSLSNTVTLKLRSKLWPNNDYLHYEFLEEQPIMTKPAQDFITKNEYETD